MKKLFALFVLIFVWCGQAGAETAILNDPDVVALKGYDIGFVGFSLRHKGKNKEVIALCDELLKREPQNAEAHFQKGRAFGELRKWPEAVESFTLAIKYNRDGLGEAYYYRGHFFELLGRLEEALSDYEKAIELGYDDRDVYFLRDGVMIKLGIDMSK